MTSTADPLRELIEAVRPFAVCTDGISANASCERCERCRLAAAVRAVEETIAGDWQDWSRKADEQIDLLLAKIREACRDGG